MLQAATSTSIIQLHISENLTQPLQWICRAKRDWDWVIQK